LQIAGASPVVCMRCARVCVCMSDDVSVWQEKGAFGAERGVAAKIIRRGTMKAGAEVPKMRNVPWDKLPGGEKFVTALLIAGVCQVANPRTRLCGITLWAHD